MNTKVKKNYVAPKTESATIEVNGIICASPQKPIEGNGGGTTIDPQPGDGDIGGGGWDNDSTSITGLFN